LNLRQLHPPNARLLWFNYLQLKPKKLRGANGCLLLPVTTTPQGLPTGWLAKIQQPGPRRLHRSGPPVYLKAGRGGGATPACATPGRNPGGHWTNHRNTGPDRSRKNRVAQTDRPPDGATKPRPPAVQKARTCDRPDFAKGQTGQPCRTGQPWPIVSSEPARPTRSCFFFARAQRPS